MKPVPAPHRWRKSKRPEHFRQLKTVGCCFETTISLETWFKVLLKRKFKVAFFYLKYFFIPRRSLITKNNATLRPRSRRDWHLKCGTKEGQNLQYNSASLNVVSHWLNR